MWDAQIQAARTIPLCSEKHEGYIGFRADRRNSRVFFAQDGEDAMSLVEQYDQRFEVAGDSLVKDVPKGFSRRARQARHV